jgi:hypothetical protein
MQAIEQPYTSDTVARLAGTFGIYWLAFLVTGHRESRLDVTLEIIEQDDPRPFFSAWMAAWSKRVAIAKALAAIRGELDESARWTASRRAEKSTLPASNSVLDRETTKIQIERALLAIDVFPRCALLLSVFEGMSLEDAEILLDADEALVRKGQRIGFWELTRNLPRMQGWTLAVPDGFAFTSEMQHA